MAFNSYEFLFAFLPLTIVGFWLLARPSNPNGAIAWLIIASLALHACAGWRSLLIIATSILLTFVFVRILLRVDASRERLRLWVLVVGVATDVALLCYFKYQYFFVETTNKIFATDFDLGIVALPLGISFLTFQKISLLVDVYGERVVKVNVLDYALFALFFPRAVAGPIVRYDEVVPQFASIGRGLTADNARVAACLFAIGLFKKTVLSDSLGEFADPVFSSADPYPRSLFVAWSGALAYTLQLYFDFSGYSDMALGAARLFGVRLPANFDSPLKASSIIEFWNRWHITLTRFLTAYVYTPIVLQLTRARIASGRPVLRGKRSAISAIVVLIGVPTLFTMAISGVWHGAGWQFLIWGLLHGVYLTINQSWRILRARFVTDQRTYEALMKPVGWVLTFGAVVIAMVFFRATSLDQAVSLLGSMFGVNGILPHDAQLLQVAGIDVLGVANQMQPMEAFVWIAVLLAGSLLLPNSLEILRRSEPALDSAGATALATLPDNPSGAVASGRIRTALRSAWMAMRRYRSDGIPLTRLTAAVAALMWLLGVMSISSSTAFLYGQF